MIAATILQDRSIDIGHTTLAAQESGVDAPLRLLALHGWLDNSASFIPLAKHLGEVHLVALDLPGHGLSPARPPEAAYLFADWVKDVVGALDALGWERCTLLGHSMGGGIAAMVAATVPERIDRLLLIEGLGAETSPPTEAASQLQRHIAARRKPHQDKVYPDLATLSGKVATALRLDPENAQLLVARGSRKTPDGDGLVWRTDHRLFWPSVMRFTEEQVLALLRAIACPTLLVWAEDGFPFDREVMEARVRAVRQIETVRLRGGHHLHMSEPELVASVLRRYFG